MKMMVAEQLAMMTVGTTKRRAKPTRKKVMAIETRMPRKRQVERETRRVVAAKARKRTSGRPVNAVCVVRKACIWVSEVFLRGRIIAYCCFRVLASVFSGPLEHVLALLGRQHLVGGGLDLITHSSRGVVNLVAQIVDHVARCLENGRHGGGRGDRWDWKQVQWSMKRWMMEMM